MWHWRTTQNESIVTNMAHKQLETAVAWWQLWVRLSNYVCQPHCYVYTTDPTSNSCMMKTTAKVPLVKFPSFSLRKVCLCGVMDMVEIQSSQNKPKDKGWLCGPIVPGQNVCWFNIIFLFWIYNRVCTGPGKPGKSWNLIIWTPGLESHGILTDWDQNHQTNHQQASTTVTWCEVRHNTHTWPRDLAIRLWPLPSMWHPTLYRSLLIPEVSTFGLHIILFEFWFIGSFLICSTLLIFIVLLFSWYIV